VLRNESARLEPLSAASLKGVAAPAARKPAPPEPDAGTPWGWIILAAAASAALLLGLRRRTLSLRRLTPH
jgi:hypothetical protein